MQTVECNHCQQPYAPDQSLGELCPACLFAHALPADQEQPPITPSPGMPRFVPPKINELSPHFPQLEIFELAGKGGMSAVYRAHHKHLDRSVALKVLPREVAASLGSDRFRREARVLGQLSHPNIVDVYDSGQSGPWCYIVMEFVHGPNLRQLLGDSQLGTMDVVRITSGVCEGLQCAHEQGIVHRDIKPENVLLTPHGDIKLVDFGLAKFVQSADIAFLSTTATRDVMGTPHYLAPEQRETPEQVDRRADIYSLGVMMYEMLTGELPVGHFDPPSQRRGSDPALDAVVLRAMSKDRQRRYADVQAIQHALNVPVATRPKPERRPHWHVVVNEFLLSVCAVVAVAIGLTSFASEADPSQPERVAQRLENRSLPAPSPDIENRSLPTALTETKAELDTPLFVKILAGSWILIPFGFALLFARLNLNRATSWHDVSPLQAPCVPILLVGYVLLMLAVLLAPGFAICGLASLPLFAQQPAFVMLGQEFGLADRLSALTPYWLNAYGFALLVSSVWAGLIAACTFSKAASLVPLLHPTKPSQSLQIVRLATIIAVAIMLPAAVALLIRG